MDNVCTLDSIRVIGIPGSLRRDGYTRKAVKVALEGAAALGCQTSLVDFSDHDLIFANGDLETEEYPPKLQALLETVRQAHGIILGTPEYHGSYSGLLKNALDLMGFDEFEGKMLGLVGVSGGAMGAMGAMSELRNVGRALHSWVVPDQAAIPHARQAFDEQGILKDPRLERRLKTVGEQVARFAHLHLCGESQKFLQLWQQAPENPGGQG